MNELPNPAHESKSGLVIGSQADLERHLQSSRENLSGNESLGAKTKRLTEASAQISDFYDAVHLNMPQYINSLWVGSMPNFIPLCDLDLLNSAQSRDPRSNQLFLNWWHALESARTEDNPRIPLIKSKTVSTSNGRSSQKSRLELAASNARVYTGIVVNHLENNPELRNRVGAHFEQFHLDTMDMAIETFAQGNPELTEVLEAIKIPSLATIDTISRKKPLTLDSSLARIKVLKTHAFTLNTCLDAVAGVLTIQEALGLPLSQRNSLSKEVINHLESLNQESPLPQAA